MTDLKPCPMCDQALQPFWGRNDERKLNVAGHVHPDDGPVVCALDGFVVYPQNYDKWNRRPLPAAGADPYVVESDVPRPQKASDARAATGPLGIARQLVHSHAVMMEHPDPIIRQTSEEIVDAIWQDGHSILEIAQAFADLFASAETVEAAVRRMAEAIEPDLFSSDGLIRHRAASPNQWQYAQEKVLAQMRIAYTALTMTTDSVPARTSEPASGEAPPALRGSG